MQAGLDHAGVDGVCGEAWFGLVGREIVKIVLGERTLSVVAVVELFGVADGCLLRVRISLPTSESSQVSGQN